MRRVLVLVVIALAGCPSKTPQAPGSPQAGVGCPSASNVYLAQYVTPEGKGYRGWSLPLHDARVDSLDGKPAFAAIDAAAATAAGVPAAPSGVWLLPSNGAMCKATVGGYYAAAVDAQTKNVSYGVTLAGCPAPAEGDDPIAIAMVSVEPPTQCQPIAPALAASRLGETSAQNVWSRPTKETPLPPEFAGVVPERACVAPDCEKLWSVGRVDVGGKPVAWSGAVNWLEIPDGSPASAQCTWKVDTFAGFYVTSPDGKLVKVTEGQDHPLVLALVLADRTGAKVLIADGTGEYATYDIGAGAATLGRHVTWFLDDPQAYGISDHLGPTCAPTNP